MNKTGLAESLFPQSTSPMFCLVANDNEWKRFLIPGIPSNFDFFKNTSLPLLFEFNPLKCPCKEIDIMESLKTSQTSQNDNYCIPKCSRCLAYPSKYCFSDKKQWICSICGEKNPIRSNDYLPSTDSFDLTYENSSLQPLFLFIIQPTKFFSDPQVLSQIGHVLDEWAHQNDFKVALISLGQISISFDLKNTHSYFFIDEPPYLLPCNSRDAHFELCLQSLKSSPSPSFLFLLGNLFLSLLSTKTKSFQPAPNKDYSTNPNSTEQSNFSNNNINNNNNNIYNSNTNRSINNIQNQTRKPVKQFILATIFANEVNNVSELDFEAFQDEIIMQLFTTTHFLCETFAKLCYRINIIGDYSSNNLAPRLSTMLTSGSLFDSVIRLYLPPFLESDLSIYNGLFENSFCKSPYLDGQSSACFQVHLKKIPTNPQIYIQMCLSGLLGNGKRFLRVITIQLQSIWSIEAIDGPLYGVFLGRKIAAYLSTHSESSSLLYHRKQCIDLISEWSKDGSYRRSILEICRDIPLFMFSIEQYLFSKSSTNIEKIALKKDFLRMCCSILQRELYPSLIFPPMNCPNRLLKENILRKKISVFLGGCEGIALVFEEGHEEEIETISKKYQIPLTILKDGSYDNADNFLVEDQGPTFSSYTKKMEVEVNGRRF